MSSGNIASKKPIAWTMVVGSKWPSKEAGKEQESASHHCTSVRIVPEFNTADKHLCSSVTRAWKEMHCAVQWRGRAGCVWGREALLALVWDGLGTCVWCRSKRWNLWKRTGGRFRVNKDRKQHLRQAWRGSAYHWKKGWEHRYRLLLLDFLLLSGLGVLPTDKQDCIKESYRLALLGFWAHASGQEE